MREAVAERERLQEQLIGISNQVIRWLDIRFLNLLGVFKDWSAKTAMARTPEARQLKKHR